MNQAWNNEKERAKFERMNRKIQRIMAAPPARGEMLDQQRVLLEHVSSVALAIEALEMLLVEKGILASDELMAALGKLIETKREQAKAAEVAGKPVDGAAPDALGEKGCPEQRPHGGLIICP